MAIVLCLVPIFLFVKSWYQSHEPKIDKVTFFPDKKFYKIIQEVKAIFNISLPPHLEVEKVSINYGNDKVLSSSKLIYRIYGGLFSRKLYIDVSFAAIDQTQIKDFFLIIKANKQIYKLKFSKILSFVVEQENNTISPKLIEKLKLEKSSKKENKTSNILLYLVIGLSIFLFLSFSLILIFLKRAKKLSAYQKALQSLDVLGTEINIQKYDDILSSYLDEKFTTKLSYVIGDEKTKQIEKIGLLSQELKQKLIHFYIQIQEVKFLPSLKVDIPFQKEDVLNLIVEVNQHEIEKK